MTLLGKLRGIAVCKNCGFEQSFFNGKGRESGEFNRTNSSCPHCGVTQGDWEEAVRNYNAGRIMGLRTRRYELFESTDCGADSKRIKEVFGEDPVLLIPFKAA